MLRIFADSAIYFLRIVVSEAPVFIIIIIIIIIQALI